MCRHGWISQPRRLPCATPRRPRPRQNRPRPIRSSRSCTRRTIPVRKARRWSRPKPSRNPRRTRAGTRSARCSGSRSGHARGANRDARPTIWRSFPLPLRERVVDPSGTRIGRVRGACWPRPLTRLADFVRSAPSPARGEGSRVCLVLRVSPPVPRLRNRLAGPITPAGCRGGSAGRATHS